MSRILNWWKKENPMVKAAWISGAALLLAASLTVIFNSNEKIKIDLNISDKFSDEIRTGNTRGAEPSFSRLPDGRIRVTGDFRKVIAGMPSVLIEEFESSREAFEAEDYQVSLRHAQNAIEAYTQAWWEFEREDKKGLVLAVGSNTPEFIGKMYIMGMIAATSLGQDKLAYEYVLKAVEADPSSENKAVLAAALLNLGKRSEAIAKITEEKRVSPNNRTVTQIAEFIESKDRITFLSEWEGPGGGL